jgi:aminocarboxymuconate-semialdehyde decarboxylase
MKVDIHTHMMPDTMPNWVKKFGYGEFIHLEHKNCQACMMKGDKLFRIVEPNCFQAADRLADMESQATSCQVLSTIPVLFNYWAKPADGYDTSRYFNDHLAKIANDHPKKFIAIGTVPLQDTDLSILEMERCIHSLNMPGLEIGTNVNGINLGDSRFHAFFAAAEKLNCSLFIHPWDMMGEADIQDYWLPWLVGMPAETTRAICSLIFSGVLEKYPKLRIAFAHGGGSFPYTLGRIEHGFQVRPDLVAIHNQVNPQSYLGKIWFDSLVHDPLSFHVLLQKAGVDKICLGSDYPFPLGEHYPGQLISSLDLPTPIQEKLFFRNAIDWLNLDNAFFD